MKKKTFKVKYEVKPYGTMPLETHRMICVTGGAFMLNELAEIARYELKRLGVKKVAIYVNGEFQFSHHVNDGF